MAPTPGILYVTMQPKESLPISQFHDWYNNDHGPTRLRLSFCQNGFRYKANDNDYSATKPEWMAIYDIEDMDWLTKDVYTRLRQPPVQAQRERDTMKQITVDRRFYDFISETKGDDFKKLESIENVGRGNVLVAVILTLQDGEDKEKELAKWYEQEHVPLLQKVPGWRRTRRFVTSYLDIEAGKPKEFLSIHEYAPQNGLGGPEFKAATSTPWNDEIYKSVVKEKRRRTYDLSYTFGAGARDLTSLTDANTIQAESTDSLTKTYPSSVAKEQHPVIESYITTPDGVQIPYRLEGAAGDDKPVIVCINSILTTYNIWDDFVPAFQTATNSQYRILRYNSRGRSTLPEFSISPITIATLSQDVITLLDTLRIPQATLIGVSLGGATALYTALHNPTRITSFVSCDTNSLAPPGNPKAWGERIAMAEQEGAISPTTNSSSSNEPGEPIVGESLSEITVRRWFTQTTYTTPSLIPKISSVKSMVSTNSLQGFKRSVNALYEYDFRNEMKTYKGKGAFLVGAEDGVLPGTMRDMAGALGDGVHLEVVDGAGHLPMVERAGEVARFLAGFVKG